MVGESPHGIARYALALWEGLPADPAIQYTALVAGGSSVPTSRPGDALLRCYAPFLSPAEQLELPWRLRRARIDLLHATSMSVPAAWRGPLVLTLHDVNHLALPGWTGPGRQPYYERIVRPAARRAAQVLTVSEFSAAEIVRWLGLPRAKVRVAPNAIDPLFRPQSPEVVAELRGRLGLPESYVLYVGNGRPHKNVELLWELARLAPQLPLVLAGRGLEPRGPLAAVSRTGSGEPPFGPSEVEDRMSRRFAPRRRSGRTEVASRQVRLVPEIADADLPALYGGASLFLFPSRYEGFGLPPLEAAACGAPVLVARGSSMDEVWAGTGSLLPPDQPAVWLSAIKHLRGDETARQGFVARDSERASRYRSWEPAITAAREAYQEVLRLT